jgi:hypothetical protein
MKACYRVLRNYKYQLVDDYVIQIDIMPEHNIEYKFLSLSSDGVLTVRKHYAWDGPSGPTVDRMHFMRGSLVHDALYQLMRLSALDYQVHRKRADELLREICIEDGMSSFKGWLVYQAVHIFAAGSARPQQEPEVEIVCVPR